MLKIRSDHQPTPTRWWLCASRCCSVSSSIVCLWSGRCLLVSGCPLKLSFVLLKCQNVSRCSTVSAPIMLSVMLWRFCTRQICAISDRPLTESEFEFWQPGCILEGLFSKWMDMNRSWNRTVCWSYLAFLWLIYSRCHESYHLADRFGILKSLYWFYSI